MSVEVPAQLQGLVKVSPQRWLLGAIAVVAGAGASVVAGVSGGGLPPLVLLIVVALAVLSAVLPDSHAALVLVAVVLWQWMVVADDPTGPAVVVVALALLVFHSTIALMAPGPVTVRLDPTILHRWLCRTALVAIATATMWGLVLLMAQRRASGSVVVTFAGFVTALVLVALLRSPRRSRELVRE